MDQKPKVSFNARLTILFFILLFFCGGISAYSDLQTELCSGMTSDIQLLRYFLFLS